MAEEVVLKFKADMSEIRASVSQLEATLREVDDNTNINPIDPKAKNDVKELSKEVKELDSNTNSAANSIENYKKRLALIKRELATLDENSQRFKQLSEEAGVLQDKIGDISSRIKVLASDTKRLDAFLGGVQGIAGALSAAQGASALFGEENEDLNRAILKVQASLSLLNGVQAVAAVLNKDSAFSILILSKAQAALNAIMSANPIFLVVTAIAALGVAITAIVGKFDFFIKAWEAVGDGISWVISKITSGVAWIGEMSAAVLDFIQNSKALRVALGIATLGISEVVVRTRELINEYNKQAQLQDELARKEKERIDALQKRSAEISKQATDEIKQIQKIQKERQKAAEQIEKNIDHEINKRRAAGQETADIERKKLNFILQRAKEELAAEEAKNERLKQLLADQAKLFGVTQEEIIKAAKARGLDVDAIEKARLKAIEDSNEKIKEAERNLELFNIEKAKKAADRLKEENEKLRQLEISLIRDAQLQKLAELDSAYAQEIEKFKNRSDILLALEKKYQKDRLELMAGDVEKVKNRQGEETKVINEDLQGRSQLYNLYVQGILQADEDMLDKRLKDIQREKEIFDARANLIQDGINLAKSAASLFISDSEQLAEFNKQLAIFQTSLELAKSLAAIITSAAQAAAQTGALAPFTLAAYVASGTAAVFNAFAQIKQILSQPVPKFSKGVEYLTGAGTETSDSIPAYLSKGERVITAQKNKQYWDELHAIHNGTFESLILNKYLKPVLSKDKWKGDNIVQVLGMTALQSKRHHKELIIAINKKNKINLRQW